jgi:hypothetical protein
LTKIIGEIMRFALGRCGGGDLESNLFPSHSTLVIISRVEGSIILINIV